MEQYVINPSSLTDIASAIREKRGGISDMWLPSEMPAAIRAISGGGGYDSRIALWAIATLSRIEDTDGKILMLFDAEWMWRIQGTLEYVSFPACTYLGDGLFSSFYGLSEAYLPKCSYVGSSAFYANHSLEVTDFRECEYVGSYAFYACRALSSVSLPACTYLGQDAFWYCTALESVYLLGSSVCTLAASNAFAYTPMRLSSFLGYFGSIFVPASLYDDYITATGWSYYSRRIVGI